MPNHVRNIIKMQGITELDLFTEVDGVRCFDFNKVLRMPESLDVTCGTETDMAIVYFMTKRLEWEIGTIPNEQKALIKGSLHGLSKSDWWISEIISRLLEWEKGHTSKDKNEMYDKGRQYMENYLRYGSATWYDWCCENWGTKWNAYDCEQIDENTIKFSTAWSRPEPIMKLLAVMYPDARIEHWWADEDTGHNTGHVVYEHMGVDGGENANESNEAYEAYVFCWGESNCIYKDENGNWQHHDCDSCTGCD